MGSLMAGWTTQSRGAEQGLDRTGSFTKSEIEQYWKSRKAQHDEHAAHVEAHMTLQKKLEDGETVEEEVTAVMENPFSPDDPDFLTEEEKKAKVKDWWRRSNFAFLNTPPDANIKDVKGGTYVTQYDVATQASVNETHGMSSN